MTVYQADKLPNNGTKGNKKEPIPKEKKRRKKPFAYRQAKDEEEALQILDAQTGEVDITEIAGRMTTQLDDFNDENNGFRKIVIDENGVPRPVPKYHSQRLKAILADRRKKTHSQP